MAGPATCRMNSPTLTMNATRAGVSVPLVCDDPTASEPYSRQDLLFQHGVYAQATNVQSFRDLRHSNATRDSLMSRTEWVVGFHASRFGRPSMLRGRPRSNGREVIFRVVHDYDKNGPFWFPVSDRSLTDVRIFGATRNDHSEEAEPYGRFIVSRRRPCETQEGTRTRAVAHQQKRISNATAGSPRVILNRFFRTLHPGSQMQVRNAA